MHVSICKEWKESGKQRRNCYGIREMSEEWRKQV